MIKKIALMSMIVITTSLAACSSQDSTKLVGHDRDAHHCISSAGYQWSTLQQQCIRIFESGITLLPLDSQQSSASFAVFSKDQQQVELFIPEISHSIILDKQPNATQWQGHKNYRLLETSNKQFQLYSDHKLVYESKIK